MIPAALIPGAEWLPLLAPLPAKATLVLAGTAAAAALAPPRSSQRASTPPLSPTPRPSGRRGP